MSPMEKENSHDRNLPHMRPLQHDAGIPSEAMSHL